MFPVANQINEAPRAIIHVDMDAFYCAVEERDDPALKGSPVIVGGLGPRGVVATANYAARKFGVHSAIPMARARRLCPRAHYIRPRMGRYQAASRAIFQCFEKFTPQIEGLSLDEAFLEVTASLKLFGSIEVIGRRIKETIRAETGLIASVGMAHNKFLAKLASDARKPDGLLLVRADEALAFLDPMPISRLWGVGAKTAPKLRALGVLTIGQLRVADVSVLEPVLGKRTAHFQRLANGLDEREFSHQVRDKSISHEVTFDEDILNPDKLRAELQRQAERVSSRVRAQGFTARTVVVKIRDRHFRTVTRSSSLRAGSSSTRTLYRMARALFESWRKAHLNTPVRLLGMGVSGLESGIKEGDQLDDTTACHLDHVVDEIADRFGSDAIFHAQTIKRTSK